MIQNRARLGSSPEDFMKNQGTRICAKTAIGILTLGTMATACSAGPQQTAHTAAGSSVVPTVAITNRMGPALQLGELASIDGTYGADCIDRSGPWSVAVGGSSVALNNARLSVAEGDSNCVLTMTALNTRAAYVATPPLAMTSAYQPSGSAFAALLDDGGSAPIVFYANAMLSSTSFTGDFVINIVYSDDPSLVSSNASTSYVTHSATAATSQAPAPDYTIDLSPITVRASASNVVLTATGSASLSFNTVAGQFYAVDSAGALTASPTFAEVDGFYRSQTPAPVSGNATTIPAAAFALAAATLPAVRSVVVANTSSGVPSYEVVSVTFDLPSSAPPACPASFGGSVDQSEYVSSEVEDYGLMLTQQVTGSFTAGTSGTLTGIELQLVGCNGSLSDLAEVHLAITDGSNNPLGTVTVPESTVSSACNGAPLSPDSTGPGLFDLTSLCINVTAGEVIQYTLSMTDPGPPPTCNMQTMRCSNGTGNDFCMSDPMCQAFLGIAATPCPQNTCILFKSYVE
jgi:hypothetical protein